MTMTDPIADMLTRIRNASMVKKAEVLIPYSKFKYAVAKILEKEKYVEAVEKTDLEFKYIKIKLKYEDNKPAIGKIRRVSRVGQRIYVKKVDLPRVLNNYGLAIVSTSKGIMTNREAKHLGLGGEVICEVY
ncbi:30S ribosomal protein S8 [Candidatus Falkowbacteria bacterium]|jgi:small subunit ribosomal protein S8|nr:30S ribosomal protein S8 [Candidatus Falkowbacteria bacterium]MBT5503001.1 30S ribosomal protein S8 [Candidatus Falkowbacteria bacterium]MBT6574357.1 30S ribosomal protein S8 [Candidatus Falkowbacteria bacterium]MBT7349050.1 30S ribosomal protein S8 [Candidatus Falkowbacteria bacterium]MBT7500956.1 30S ribosomal protein S8 [Candidatus Falkowbacteria bacterium]